MDLGAPILEWLLVGLKMGEPSKLRVLKRLIVMNYRRPRGIPRRLRALDRWAQSFTNSFPVGLEPADRYWNWKIPVLRSLVEGRYARPKVQAACAQRLIEGCDRLIQSKPEAARKYRVVCTICLPDFFTSEICLYLQEDYFQSHTAISVSSQGSTRLIANYSLSSQWQLQVPAGMGELGLALDHRGDRDPADWFVGDRWYFGETQERP
jgi:Protein of unknown function (DUF3916)